MEPACRLPDDGTGLRGCAFGLAKKMEPGRKPKTAEPVKRTRKKAA
jgi:hypothetical protein